MLFWPDLSRSGQITTRSLARSQQYTPLNTPLEQVLVQIKDDPSLKWPKKTKGNPNKHNRNKYYRFNRDHGHDMDECFDLKQQIENLIRQGNLRNFLGRDQKDEKLKGKLTREELLRISRKHWKMFLWMKATPRSSQGLEQAWK